MAHPAGAWGALVSKALAEGQAYFQRGDHQAAIMTYGAALAALAEGDLPAPERAALEARLYHQRGHSRFIQRDLPGALEDYGQALERDPRLAEAYAYRALIAYQTGKAVSAVADYTAAITCYLQQEAETPAARRALAEAYFNRGNAQYQRRDYQAAEDDYRAALALEPDLVDALIYRGVARYQRGDYAGAAADYDRALAHTAITHVQRAVIAYNRGLLLRQQGDLEGAIEAYSQALELQPQDADCLMNRGNAYAEQGDLQAAIADYSAALRLNPWLEDGFNTCGVARLAAGDLEGAIADFSRAIRLNPQAGGVHFNRGCARLQLGDLDGAIEDFTAELALRPPGLKGRVETREQRAAVYNNRGLAYHYQGRYDVAITDYERSLQQLQMIGGPEAIGERMASTLLNRAIAYRDYACAQPVTAPRAEYFHRAAADLEQALRLTSDPALGHALRQHLGELELQEKGGMPGQDMYVEGME